MLFPVVFNNIVRYILLATWPLPVQVTPLGPGDWLPWLETLIVSFGSFGRMLRKCLHMPHRFFNYHSQFFPQSFFNCAEINNSGKQPRKQSANTLVSIIFRLSCEGEGTVLMYYLLRNFPRISDCFEILNFCSWKARNTQYAEALYNEKENKISAKLLLGIFLSYKYFPLRFNFNRLPLFLKESNHVSQPYNTPCQIPHSVQLNMHNRRTTKAYLFINSAVDTT